MHTYWVAVDGSLFLDRMRVRDSGIFLLEKIVWWLEELVMTVKNSPSPRVVRARARAAVTASHKTGDILPRALYVAAGVTPPDNATDVLQRRGAVQNSPGLCSGVVAWFRKIREVIRPVFR